jgi:hypothetical protein
MYIFSLVCISAIYLCIWNSICTRYDKEHNKMCQVHLAREREPPSKIEIIQFFHNSMRMSSFGVRIEDVAVFRMWRSGISSISAVVYYQLSDSQKFLMQETQCKSLGILNVIGAARSKGETFPLVIFFSLLFPTYINSYQLKNKNIIYKDKHGIMT